MRRSSTVPAVSWRMSSSPRPATATRTCWPGRGPSVAWWRSGLRALVATALASPARATLAGTAMGIPKSRTGPVEAIRALRVARQGAVKARTAAINQMRGLVAAAPQALRVELTTLSAAVLVNRCAALTTDLSRLHDQEQATAAALAGLARRALALTEEIHALDRQLTPLVRRTAPRTSALFGRRHRRRCPTPDHCRRQPDRLHSKAALAHLCGAAPIPASSGRVRRHRLHRGGDRGANHALHTIALWPSALRRTHPRLPATTHYRRPQQAGDPALSQALHRPRRLHRPPRRLSCPEHLTPRGASGWQRLVACLWFYGQPAWQYLGRDPSRAGSASR